MNNMNCVVKPKQRELNSAQHEFSPFIKCGQLYIKKAAIFMNCGKENNHIKINCLK